MGLIRQERKPHIVSVNDIHFFIDDHIDAFGKRQQPVVGFVHFGDSAFFIHQQGHVFQAVLGDKLAVRFGRVSRQAEDFDIFGVVFFDVLLKLNKLAYSKLGVVFGIKGEHDGTILFDGIAEFPSFPVLIGKCKIGSYLTGDGSCRSDIRSRAGK